MGDEDRAFVSTSTSALSLRQHSDDVEIDRAAGRIAFRAGPSVRDVAIALGGFVVAVAVALVPADAVLSVFAFVCLGALPLAAQVLGWRQRRFHLTLLSQHPGKVQVRGRSGTTLSPISALTVQQGLLVETRKSLAVPLLQLTPPVAEAVRVWLNEHDPSLRKR